MFAFKIYLTLLLAASVGSTEASAQTAEGMDRARRDLAAGNPLPDLPDLTKPVFLLAGAIVCESPGALGNPNKEVLIAMGACVLTATRQRVNLVLPSTPEQYLDAHIFRMVHVVWRSREVSNATTFSGWTSVFNAKN
jgi:hypothetical protein